MSDRSVDEVDSVAVISSVFDIFTMEKSNRDPMNQLQEWMG